LQDLDLSNAKPQIIVVGAGNAALCAAIAAKEKGVNVLMIESAPFDERGGNSRYTGGAFRFAYSGLDDLIEVCPELANEDTSHIDFGSYSEDQFFDDMYELTEFKTDPDLCELLVRNSRETAKWVVSKGVKLQPGLGRQAFKIDGKFKFWGGLALHIWGGGEELLKALYAKAEALDIPIAYDTAAVSLQLGSKGEITGLIVNHRGHQLSISTQAVILACGGFESNSEMRARYLGPGWDLAKVRGTKFNMGAGHQMALAAGARPAGHWSGCHSVAWDVNAPEYGDLAVGDQFQKHNYPYGIMVNARGERYVDEGANFHSHTYAKYGAEIMKQPGMFAWQIFDSKVTHLLRGEYRIKRVTKVEANSLEELAAQLEGVDADQTVRTIAEFNAACDSETSFNPNIRDGKRTNGLRINKSNWANPIDTPPFHAYHVTTGVTFTFGGLKISTNGQVLNTNMQPIPGLYAAGEIVGGLFYHNYASGTGLMSGATFGRLAGEHAANLIV
jgi:tricarballylate dehydrogenase